jgi:hypothetical protein
VKFLSTGAGSGQDANAATKADTVKYYAANDVANFYIKDTQLNSVHTGNTVFLPEGADGTQANCTVAAATNWPLKEMDDNAGAVACLTSQATNAKFLGTVATPMVPGSLVVFNSQTNHTGFVEETPQTTTTTLTRIMEGDITVANGNGVNNIDQVNGTFSLFQDRVVRANNIAALIGTVQAFYDFNAKDDVAAAKRRAKVTSSSDSTGEYIAIEETSGEGETADAYSSSIFFGKVAFSTDAAHAAAGTDNGASVPTVWVQTGDTVTVDFLAACTEDTGGTCTADGAVTASATTTIDSTKPTITDISPADGTLTSDTSPTISFTVNDPGVGFNSSIANFIDHIDVVINGCEVVKATEIAVTAHSSSSISFSYDIGGTTVWSALAKRTDNTTNATQSGSGNVIADKCTAALGDAAQRVSTASGFSIDSSTLMNEDGASALNHHTTDRDRTIHGKEFSWKIIATDEVGNAKTLGGVAITDTELNLTIDSVKPARAASTPVVAAKAWNTSTKVDDTNNASIKLTFTETLDRASVAASDFTVSGTGVTDATISSISFGGKDGATDTHVYLLMAADLGPDAKPKVDLVGSVSDLAGNVRSGAAETDGKYNIGTAADGVKPTISGASFTDLYLDNKEESTLTWTANENMTQTGGAQLSCTCIEVAGGNGSESTIAAVIDTTKVAVELTSPTTGKVKIKNGDAAFGGTDTTGIYGVMIVGRDAGNNNGLGGIVKVVGEDVSSNFVSALPHANGVNDNRDIKLKNGPLADHDGDGDLKDSIYAVTDDGVDITANIDVEAVNWGEAETVNIMLDTADIAAGSVVKFSYYYVDASQVIEIDEAAPTVAVTPTNDATTENLRQRLTLAFDEDEYGWDSHTTVTVTKAELKDPAGVTADILSSLNTSDNKTFYYKPTADLDLGQYTVTVSAKDEHDNALTDNETKFTVNEKSKTTIAMEAGWNLISIPANPSDTAINSVIDNNEVTTVITYDPSIPGGWLTAVRDGGVLSGSLTTIDATRAYWIYQEDGDDIKTLIPGTTTGVQSVPPAIPVVKGWNLLPVASMNNATGNVFADVYLSNLDWNKGKGWNPLTELWIDVQSNLLDNVIADDDTLTIGKGYWIFANKAGTLIP